MVGWHHRLNEHEFEQALGDGEGQEGLVCCSPRGHKESNMTERLNSSEKQHMLPVGPASPDHPGFRKQDWRPTPPSSVGRPHSGGSSGLTELMTSPGDGGHVPPWDHDFTGATSMKTTAVCF